jgi:hypothetical protein
VSTRTRKALLLEQTLMWTNAPRIAQACYFTIEHNGDIPMQLDWQVAVASTVPVSPTHWILRTLLKPY